MNNFIMEQIIKKIISYILCIFLCGIFFYYIALPKIIENRASRLGLLRYNSKVDKLVEKDSLHISGWDLHYLKKGTMNGYVGH